MIRKAILAILLAAGVFTSTAWAGAVKGTVALPEAVRGRRFFGSWRIENGVVPVAPASAKGDSVVVLEGLKGTAPSAKSVVIEVGNLEASPRVIVLGPGSTVEFKNVDRATHELGMPDQASMMPQERLPPGTSRKQKFGVTGAYVVRCAEYPSLMVSVLVLDSPFFSVADERGVFSILSVPEGKATLKVWSTQAARFVHEQPIDVGKPGDLAIKVAAPTAVREAAE